MQKAKVVLGLAALGALAACASMPTGPRVAVMPAPGKPFELFVQEDRICRTFAQQSVGDSTRNAGVDAFASSAVAGAAIGAAVGGLMGGHDSASSGAGMGLMTGAMIGAGESDYAVSDAQRRYDIAYQQCMYSKGNQVPGRWYQTNTTNYPPPPPPSSPSPAR
jgi:hypothetical protein